jgi:uncharacterized protein YndB with AHSA1/START domain
MIEQPEPGELVLTGRWRLDAAPARVFTLVTEPDALAEWWGPHGFTTPEIEQDLREGGAYRFTMQPPEGDAFHLSGEFLHVDPPRELAFTFRWDEPDPDDRETVVVLSLEAVGDSTEVSLTHRGFATEERLALHRDGWADSFERLAQVLHARS